MIIKADNAINGARFVFVTEDGAPTSAGTGKGSMLDFDPDEPEPQMQRAHSIEYGKGHTRKISAGSVKLLDVPPTPRRPSGDVPSLPTSPTSPTSSSQQ